jgi:mRNA interferase HigB
MKIIKISRIRGYAKVHAVAGPSLEHWIAITKLANWKNFKDVKSTWSSADAVKVQSGHTVIVFDISGNKFRLITAVHYDIAKVFILRFLTHAEYSKGNWKTEL